MNKEARQDYVTDTSSPISASVSHRVNSHNERRLSARRPLRPQPLKIATRYYDFNQAQANRPTDKDGRVKKIYHHHLHKMKEKEKKRLSRRAEEKKPKRNFTPLKKTLLDHLIRKRIKTQKIINSRFHTARFVNGKKEGTYPVLRKELEHKRKRLDKMIAEEVTRLSLEAKQNFTPLKEFIMVNGISLPLNINSSFDESLNKRIKQLRRILFLDEDQVEPSNNQAVAMDRLFALKGGKGFKFLAQLILGKEKEKGKFMKRTTVFPKNIKQRLKIVDVLQLINSGKERIPIAQVRDDQGKVLIQISYLKGDKISIEILGKYIKPADLEQAVDKWLKAYDAESY